MPQHRIAVVGASGQLGSDLLPRLGDAAVPLSHHDVELTDAARLSGKLDELQPTIVVNCAAYNFVDRAEDEPERAFAVNAFGVRNLAHWCGQHAVPLMHISTDYVFGLERGDRTPWSECDPPGPLSAYGGSKLAGEWFVRSLCPRHWVVRTCGLYGHRINRSRHTPCAVLQSSDEKTNGTRSVPATIGKGNFVETMLKLAKERPELRIVSDQRCTPTSTADLAAALALLLQTEAYGLYHATNSGDCSWYEFAVEIFRATGLSPRVVPISTAEFGAKARRPAYSVLDGSKLAAVVGRAMPPWQAALREYLG